MGGAVVPECTASLKASDTTATESRKLQHPGIKARHLGGDSKGSLRPSSSGRETSARTHAVDPIKESSSSASRIKRRVVDLRQFTEGCALEEGRYVAPTNKNLSSLNDSRTSPSAYSLSSNPPGLPHYPNPPPTYIHHQVHLLGTRWSKSVHTSEKGFASARSGAPA